MRYTTKQLSAALRDLARVPSQIARPVADEISKEIQRNFDAGVDPYGKAWAPLKPSTLARGRFPPPLTDSRAGRNSVKVQPAQGAGVAITVGVAYMGIHQNGDLPRLVARRFIPIGVLPRAWRDIYQAELTKAVRRRVSGV